MIYYWQTNIRKGAFMITNIHIKNIGIIEDITISFQNGFNVITGETR